jgi:hypothetical protein
VEKFPQSEEVEAANYGRARAHLQNEEYEEAAKPLRANMQRFPQSPSAPDTQFMLAVVLGAQGTSAMQKATEKVPAAEAAWAEAERLLADIIQKRTDLALANDAQFQLGENLAARAAFEQGAKREEFLKRALEAYRAVQPKEIIIKAQETRLGQIRDALARPTPDVALRQRTLRFQQRELEKAAALQQRPDQTVAAKIKSAQLFLGLERFDEARVILSFVDQFTEDPEQKKADPLLLHAQLRRAKAGGQSRRRLREIPGDVSGRSDRRESAARRRHRISR